MAKRESYEQIEGENDPNEAKEKYPSGVDDVKGCGAHATTPDDVKGHAGHLQSAEEARNL